MHRLCLVVLFCLHAGLLSAESLGTRLFEALQGERLLEQLALEAEQSADDVNQDFLGGEGGAVFADTVARLNDPERLFPKIAATLDESLTTEFLESVLLFFESPLGQEIVNLELSARSTIFDPAVDQAVRNRVAEAGVPEVVAQIIDEGDLVARNLADAERVLRQFYMGRLTGGADDMDQAAIESLIAESMDGMRVETQAWLEAFMTLAYSPLNEEELQTYAEFWRTQAGMAYDRALFEAFAQVFEENSFALGQLVGRLEFSNEI